MYALLVELLLYRRHRFISAVAARFERRSDHVAVHLARFDIDGAAQSVASVFGGNDALVNFNPFDNVHRH
ncbi:MAG: hypothetical protein LBF62_08755, partial [Tannerellaceae bacterium]|nr:hypothetical protein [Tannerellaceae bacterium]